MNGDGRDDLVCNHVDDDSWSIGYASATSNGYFNKLLTWTGTVPGFCPKSEENKLIAGDLNGDGRDDIFCVKHLAQHNLIITDENGISHKNKSY